MYREHLDPPETENPVCPVCGWECDTVILNLNGDVIGCDNCLIIRDAVMWDEERRDIAI